MASPERKPLAVMIALRAKKPDAAPMHDEPDGDEEEGVEHEPDDEEIAACEDVIDAMKNRDAHALNKAFANWMQIYEAKKPDESYGREEDIE